MAVAVVDAGPLIAVADRSDAHHGPCVATLERPDLQLVIPALVVTEVDQMIAAALGSAADASFLRSLAEFEIEAPSGADWKRIAELVERYSDFPLGGVDASVIALAERLDTETVITLDRRHFGAVRPRHCEAFKLLPELG